jgi:hypothetical protein
VAAQLVVSRVVLSSIELVSLLVKLQVFVIRVLWRIFCPKKYKVQGIRVLWRIFCPKKYKVQGG